MDHSPSSLALFHAPRSILACSPFGPARASEIARSSGEPSRVPLAAMLALGAFGNPRACSSAVTAPGGEPRTDSVLFRVASVESAVAGPLSRPDACKVPPSELATIPRSATSSVKRASRDLSTAARPVGTAVLFAAGAAGAGRSALPLALKPHLFPASLR